MANDLTLTGPLAAIEPPRLTSPTVTSALDDNPFSSVGWRPDAAKRMLEHAKIDVPALAQEHAAALAPVTHDWLADRLRLLWKSSTPAGSLDAKAWLHETGRLLSDLPRDIVGWAIDEAVRRSARGFMPSVGEIRALADPVLAKRKRDVSRLSTVARLGEPPKPAPAPDSEYVSHEETQALLRRVWPTMGEHERGPNRPADMGRNPDRACRAPSRADYIRLFGVDPEAAQPDAMAAE